MKQDCQIALVQMDSAAGDIEQNINSILNTTNQAVKMGAQFIVFPELALSGYCPQIISDLAITLDNPAIKLLSKTAVDSQVTLLVGFPESSDDLLKPYISQLIALPDGSLEVYRKVHLGRSEKEWFTAGDELPVFTSHGVKFAVGICWDWHFPELAAVYSLKGAEVLFAPHASPSISGDRLEIWNKYMPARAYDNTVYLAACNMCGSDYMGRNYSGGSAVWGPKGETLAKYSNNVANILCVNLSAERLNKLRVRERTSMKDSFFLADRRKELYQILLELDIEPTPQDS
ncbi:Carbon-nitrogen hydrolase [Syntrophomonas zehnderi OL-4]|uniref:Carbon-nitrogen hydrolase n=1 Tax=Syntrophomonas zehnderi OL-4 TaxID=690567 RepID=A0A0E4GAH2_9FIRM|nr:nitrilase-related carbon-nitrogen hydrolase [Syntrophomonas zehnderi]CFX46863.1 Carbon-nitrogen hydrolase [Syntrophomonas zehnderi OL-4]